MNVFLKLHWMAKLTIHFFGISTLAWTMFSMPYIYSNAN